ncbi:MAG: DUF6320 domain-containing protein [Muribaculaceae bacterium]|nr:DUF6320 domain-containing protein [Roseburia sp.]MCM1430095.1 DUF6320 domain-containing protein [Muribaculaceae bacterium]MCM1492160.1 DUF6320 domain-containing protein [Muribaculaceae bacterium]
MSKCTKCNVIILDNTDKCPLCRHVLKRDGEQKNTYPDAVRVIRKFRFLENLILFLSLVAAAVLCGVNYVFHRDIPWSLVAILILIYGNVVLRLAILGRSGYMLKALSLTFLAVLMLFCIDYLTGYRGWSLEFVMPSGILLIDVAILILMLINRRNWQSYMMAQLLMILLSFLPLLLLGLGVTHIPIMPLLAAGGSVFLFLGTLILGDVKARTELKRRFHI